MDASGDNPPEPSQFLGEVRKERIAEVVAQRTRTLVTVLDRLEDSFNMAAVLRTCEAVGIQEVHVIETPEVPFKPHAKVTQGCDKWLEVYRYRAFSSCVEHLKSRGFALWASSAQASATSLYDLRFDAKVALVFGNERFGVSPELLSVSDGAFWLPMRGFTQSLNVSAAVASSLTHAVAWRAQHLGRVGDLLPNDATALEDKFHLLSVKQRKRIYKLNPR